MKPSTTALVLGLALVLSVVLPLRPDDNFNSVQTAKECGAPWRSTNIVASWGPSTVYNRSRNLIIDGTGVGIYDLARQGKHSVALDMNKPGDIDNATSYEVADPAVEFKASGSKFILTVSKIQAFVGKSEAFDFRSNSANAKAAQIAMWDALGQIKIAKDVSKSILAQKEWKSFIDRYLTEIKDADPNDFSGTPSRLWVTLTGEQNPGEIGVVAWTAALEDDEYVGGENIVFSNAISSKTLTTEASGENLGRAIAKLPDPSPGQAQTVRITWQGYFPAGTLLKAKYKKGFKPESQGYLILIQPSAFSLTLFQNREKNGC